MKLSQTDHTNSNSLDSFLFRVLSLRLNCFLHLVYVIIKDVSELSPGLLRDGNGSPVSREELCINVVDISTDFLVLPEVGFDLTDPHVNPTVVLADVKVEVLVLHSEVLTLRQLALEASVICAKLVNQVGQSISELDHSLSRDGNLGSEKYFSNIEIQNFSEFFSPWATPSDCLGHPEKPPARIFLQIQIVSPVILDHHL